MRHLRNTVFAVALIAAGAAGAQTADPRSPYTDADIDRVEERAVPSLHGILFSNLISRLPRAEQIALAGLTLETPRRISPWRPFTVWAESHRMAIVFPMETIRFLDDLATVTVAFNRAGCDLNLVATYAGMLTRSDPPEGGRFPSPIAAFDLDRDRLLADPDIDQISQLQLKTAIAFVLAHELGHVALQHVADGDAETSRMRERAADAYALRLHRLLGAPPLGASILFTMMGHAYLGAGDFPSVAAFEASFRERGTHPLDGNRLRAIGDAIEADAAYYARTEPDPEAAEVQMRTLAGEFRTLGRNLDDADVRLLQAETARTTRWDDLKNACARLRVR